MTQDKKNSNSLVRTVYMYLVCLVAIVTFIIGSVSTLNITLKYFVFDLKTNSWEQSPELACKEAWKYPSKNLDANGKFIEPLTKEEIADCIEETTISQEEQGEKQALETLSWALSAILVSLPIWIYHWRFIRKK